MNKFKLFLEELKKLPTYKYYWERKYRGNFNSQLYLEYLKAREDV
jgi:hypothetical protein